MKPLPILLGLLLPATLPITSMAAISDTYLKANADYRDTYFSYINGKAQIRLNLLAYQDAVSDLPRKQQAARAAQATLSGLQTAKQAKEAQLKTAQATLTQLQTQFADLLDKAKQDLDNPTADDVVPQLQQRKAKLEQDVASYQSDIDVEQRKIDRVKRSAEYTFYVKEIDIRKQRYEQLERDQQGLTQEINLLAAEVARLQAALSDAGQSKQSATQQIPGLKAELDRANAELTSAQQSGNAFAIQIAESKFRQAHLNLRRIEVQLDEANQAILEIIGQVEKKMKLQEDKKALLSSTITSKEKAKSEWKELHEAYLDFHKQNLAAFETRLTELKKNQDAVKTRVLITQRFITDIAALKDKVAGQSGQLDTIAGELRQLDQNIAAASAAATQAVQAVDAATKAIAAAKDTYNASLTQNKTDFDNSLKKQKMNEDALKGATLAFTTGLL